MSPVAPARSLADALVAFAAADVIGEPPDPEDVAVAIRGLRDDAYGARRLRRAIAAVDDAEVVSTLGDWLERLAEADEDRARAAHRAGEKLLQPLQMVALGAAATSAISLAGGVIAAPLAAGLVASTLGAYIVATAGRWSLSRREDRHRSEAERLARLSAMLKA